MEKIYFIIGPTASGKTKLSIELAQSINGEIINCDAFSFYKNCNIMTAKVTEEEAKIIPHHMIDFLDIKEKNYNIIKFRNEALKKIKEIRERKKIPIIVGGSNYYLESLLFEQKKIIFTEELNSELKIKLKNNLEKKNYEQIKILLDENKIKMEFHKNDRRRIKNFILRLFDEKNGLNLDYNKKLFKNGVYIIMENNDEDFIKFLIKKRIKDMIFKEKGLSEIFFVLETFSEITNNFKDHDFYGVLQSIGYKEFISLFKKIKNFPIDENFINKLRKGENKYYFKILEECLINLEVNTLNLYKKQKKWINNRIKKNTIENLIIEKLDKSIIEDKNVLNLFFSNLVKKIVNFKITENSEIKSNNKEKVILNKCEFCEKEMRGEKNWKMHISSKKHKIIKRKKNIKKNCYKNLPIFKCDKCNISFRGENNYKLHINSKKHKK